MKRAAVLLSSVIFAAACGGGEAGSNNLTGPTNTIPNVAGNYSGTTTVTLPELNQSSSCPTTTSVTQAGGGSINVAPLQIRGQCGTLSLPLGPATIDATGSLGQATGTHSESCGLYNWVASGGFFGRDMRLSIIYTSRTCYNMNITINLTR
jgi:hypothetical protein